MVTERGGGHRIVGQVLLPAGFEQLQQRGVGGLLGGERGIDGEQPHEGDQESSYVFGAWRRFSATEALSGKGLAANMSHCGTKSQ